MKFKFCGDADSPDWVLAEISQLSVLSSDQFIEISHQVIGQMVSGVLEYDELKSIFKSSTENLMGAIAAIHFIVYNAVKNDVDENNLYQEIQQLGLSIENAEALSNFYQETRGFISEKLSLNSFRINKLVGIDWRVDEVVDVATLANTKAEAEIESCCQIQLKLSTIDTASKIYGNDQKVEFTNIEVPSEKFLILLEELRQAEFVMENIRL